MQKTFKICSFLLLVSQINLFATTDSTIENNINEYLDACAKHLNFNGTALVAGKDILVAKAYGMANFEDSVLCTTQTRFNIASITKQFTAMSIMLLVQKKLLNLDDPISKFIPDYPNGEKITIHHCLTHMTGIPNYNRCSYYKWDKEYHDVREVIKLFKNEPLEFEPGTQVKYSNAGYLIAGHIVEIVSGKSLDQFMKENIFNPLGMTSTGFTFDPADTSSAFGYYKNNKRRGHAHMSYYFDMSFPYGDGHLISTIQDLYTWSKAVSSEKLLRKDLQDKLFAPHVSLGEKNEKYGYGWKISELFNHKLIWNDGGLPGFRANIYRFTDDDIHIILLSNMDPQIAPICKMSNDISAIMLNKAYEIPTENSSNINIPQDQAKQFVGTYRNADTKARLDEIIITLDNLTLKAEAKMYGKTMRAYDLYYVDENTLKNGAAGLAVQFHRDESGAIAGFEFTHGVNEYKFAKILKDLVLKVLP